MNIELTRAYVANGKTYANLEEAQVAALDALFSEHATDPASLTILKNRDAIIDILTTTAKSRPKGRAINGATRKRKKNGPGIPALRGDANAALPE